MLSTDTPVITSLAVSRCTSDVRHRAPLADPIPVSDYLVRHTSVWSAVLLSTVHTAFPELDTITIPNFRDGRAMLDFVLFTPLCRNKMTLRLDTSALVAKRRQACVTSNSAQTDKKCRIACTSGG